MLSSGACSCAGADVTHPTGFNTAEPSIAAVVGSMDPQCGRFATRVCPQGNHLEIIQVLSNFHVHALHCRFLSVEKATRYQAWLLSRLQPAAMPSKLQFVIIYAIHTTACRTAWHFEYLSSCEFRVSAELGLFVLLRCLTDGVLVVMAARAPS